MAFQISFEYYSLAINSHDYQRKSAPITLQEILMNYHPT